MPHREAHRRKLGDQPLTRRPLHLLTCTLLVGLAGQLATPLAAGAAISDEGRIRGLELCRAGAGWERNTRSRLEQLQRQDPSFTWHEQAAVQLPPGSAPPGHQDVRNLDFLLHMGGNEYVALENATGRLTGKTRDQIPKDATLVSRGPVLWQGRRIYVQNVVYVLMYTPDPNSKVAREMASKGLSWVNIVSGENNFHQAPPDRQVSNRLRTVFARIPGLPPDYRSPLRSASRRPPRMPGAGTTAGVEATAAAAAADALGQVAGTLQSLLERSAATAAAQRVYDDVNHAIRQIQERHPRGETVWVQVTLGGHETCEFAVDAGPGYEVSRGGVGDFRRVRTGYDLETGNVRELGRGSCQAYQTQTVEDPLQAGSRRDSVLSPPPRRRVGPNDLAREESWVYAVENICVPGTGGPAAAVSAYILEGIGLVVAPPDVVKSRPHCHWNGGGPRPCPGAPPAKVVAMLGGPYPSEQAAKADLKVKLECFKSHWGTFIKHGSANAWLQNNVTAADCRTVQQL